MIARLMLKLACAVVPLVATLVLVTHALAYDSVYFGQIDTFLTPSDDCPQPCFMGIRPGITTVQEAVTILSSNAWVAKVRVYLESPRTYDGLICWQWSGRQPALINPDYSASPCLHTHGDSSIIAGITIPTRIPFGAVWVLMRPQSMLLTDMSRLNRQVVYSANFRQQTLHVSPDALHCPITIAALWDSPTLVEFGEMSPSYIYSTSRRGYDEGDVQTWRSNLPC